MEHADAQFNARVERYNNTVSLISWLDDLIKMWTEWLKSFYLTLKRIAFCGPLANTLMEHQQQKWMLMSPSLQMSWQNAINKLLDRSPFSR